MSLSSWETPGSWGPWRRRRDGPGAAASGRGDQFAARRAGLRLVRGGRFFHLIGANDKGRAVSALRGLYERARGPLRAVGLGDSLNDAPMLRVVDIPVLVRRADGTYDPGIDLPGLVRAPGVGPEGWREAVLAILTGGNGPPS